MVTCIALRRREPGLERPFRVPFYPVFPVVALGIAAVCLVALVTLYVKLSIIYFSILLVSYIAFCLTAKGRHAR